MDEIKEKYGKLDKMLDELEGVEYRWRSMVYVLEQLQETYDHPGREGMEMIAVWIKDFMKDMDIKLRDILNRMDDVVFKEMCENINEK